MRPISVVTLVAAVGSLAFGVALPPAWAQQTQSAEPPATPHSTAPDGVPTGVVPGAVPIILKSQIGGDRSAWVKLCEKNAETQNKGICLINNETIDANSGLPIIATAVRKVEGDATLRLVVTLSQAALLAIPAGVRINVDDGKPVFLTYTYCYGMTCEASTELSKELLNNLRKGKRLTVAFVKLQGESFGIGVDLSGFAGAYDGPSIDAAKYREARNTLINTVRQRRFELAKAEGSQAAPSTGEGPSPSQPQPVYPEGPPAGEASPSTPSAP